MTHCESLIFLTGILVGPSALPDLPIMLLAFAPLWFTNTSAIGWDATYSKQIWPCKARRYMAFWHYKHQLFLLCVQCNSLKQWMEKWGDVTVTTILQVFHLIIEWHVGSDGQTRRDSQCQLRVANVYVWWTLRCWRYNSVGDITVLTQSIHSVCISDIMWAGVNEGPTSTHNICENFSLCPWRMFLSIACCSLNRWQIVFQ